MKPIGWSNQISQLRVRGQRMGNSYEKVIQADEAMGYSDLHPQVEAEKMDSDLEPTNRPGRVISCLSKARSRVDSRVYRRFGFVPVWACILLGTVAYAPVSLAQPQAETSTPTRIERARTVSEACVQATYQPEIEQAIATCERAVLLNQILGDQRIKAYSLGNLGTLYLQQQDYQQAITFYLQALQIAQTIADPSLEIKALIALGTAYSHLGESQQALSFYQQALEIAETAGDGSGTAVALYNLGLMYDALRQYQPAMEAYQNAATVAQEIGDPILQVYAVNKLQLASEALASGT